MWFGWSVCGSKMEEKERHQWIYTRISRWIIIGLLVLELTTRNSHADPLQAPRFITQPSNSGNIVPEGRIKILQCQALGYPQPKYRWLKDGQPLGDFTSELFYRIHSTRREDAGSYQCVAKNDAGSIFSQKSDVSVAYMGAFEDLSEKVVSVPSGSAAILDLPPIKSHPRPSVAWLSDGGPLPYDRKFAITSRHQLVVLATSSADQRAYRARATNTQLGKEELSGFTRLVVTGDDERELPPEIVVKPEDVNLIKGGAIPHELQCIANARPLHELETLWLKDNILLENAGVAYQFNDPWNNTLSLLSPNLTHTGRYTCQVRLRSGGFPTVTASADVVVLEKPSFTSPMRVETLGEYGAQQMLPCEATGLPAPNVTWYRDANPLPTSSNTGQYSVREDGALIIRRLGIEDTGMFQCVAANAAGEESQYTWLKVKTAAPVLTAPPVNVTVLDGKDAVISCRALGAPAPNVTWIYRDSGLVEVSARVQILENGDLLLADCRETDAGKYTCIRANEAGSVQGSAHLAILVRTQIIQPPVDTRVLLGHTATLQCKVSSDPTVPYQLFWYHNDEVITAGSNARVIIHEDGTLEIQAVRASDVGEYACALHSPGGNDTRSGRLSVIELPFPPSHVTAQRLPGAAQRAVNVSWTPGFDGNAPVLQYIIQRLEVSQVADAVPLPDLLANWVTELSNVSSDARWVLLTNLKAAASYQFRVSAVNSVGEGPPSEPSNLVILPQEAPSGAPLSFVGSARSSSEIILQWQQPLEEHRNGQILGYVIRFRLYGYHESPWTLRNITNEAQKTFLITDLITWKEYIVQIAAYNNKGVGVFSKDLRIKTREGVPEAAPVDVRASAVNSTCVRITWRPPDPQKINGINLGYRLQAWQGQQEAKSLRVAPSLVDPWAEQMALMGGLDKFAEYNMTVLCFTDPGDGKRSSPVYVRTNEDVPEEIGSLQFSNVSDRAVRVVWTPPSRSNGILRGYSLIYSVRDRPDTSKVLNVSAEVHDLMVDHLQATTHYKFEVSAWTSVGRGPSRIATIQSGVEPVLPHPPTRLAVTNIEAFSVVLQFTPGFDGNSSITRWLVEGQTARNASWFPVTDVTDPEASTLTVTDLIPYTTYRLRVMARNVAGTSQPSEPTKEFQTIQAPPAHSPRNVTVRAMSATELRVRWIPLQQTEWFGNPSGYHIHYTELGTGKQKDVVIEDPTANSHILEHLEEFALYEVTMASFNDVGPSEQSPSAVERTRESVPSFGPLGVEANATSSTTIVVKWGEVPKEHQNGLIEGYKVYYAANARAPFLFKTIASNSTFTTTLTELRKFVLYHIQVMAYTRLGDGTLSMPPSRVQTFEDTPGPPSNVSFPDVSFTTARIIWDVPSEPNGQILAYRVDYHLDTLSSVNLTREFPPSDRTFRATGLDPEQYYLFSVTAQTRLGWGKTAYALVFTTNNREPPQPPSAPQVSRSQIQSERITFSWTPGRDGFAPLRYYTVQQSEGKGPWISVPEKVDPQLTSYTVTSLKPFTSYRFRIEASNDIGPSGWSQESTQVRTLPAAPSRGVTNLKVVPITVSSVRVQWTPVDESYWSGDQETGGYRIIYQPASDFPTALQDTPKEDIYGIRKDRVVLSDLTRDKNYEIVVVPFNSQGDGPPSPPVTVYVGEAVPTGEPRDLLAEPVSATEVRLRWSPPAQSQQNGDLLGYKIFYLVTDAPQESDRKTEEEIEVVPATYTSHSLVFLDKYTQYRIQMLAFNPAGDGPRSAPVAVRTLQGLPGPPATLTFSQITMTSLLVSWQPPRKRNGDIVGYIVTYETMGRNEQFSKQVRQVSESSLMVTGLEEEVTYLFMVRAKTLDLGPAVVGNVTTGPQEGSPGRPKDLQLGKTVSSVDLHWTNGNSGKGPILGYYIQTRRKDDTRWQIVTKTNNGPLQDFTISYQNLLPSTSYNFRVIAYNKYGISYPVYADDMILTPSKLYLEYGYLQQKPFYRQTWFMVALAASSIIIIIMVIAILCVKSKTYKYKQEAAKTLEESMGMDMDDRQELAKELFRGRQSGVGGTLGRRPPAPLGKSPPRPSPASVAYHSDEESLKGYDENPDDSSLTEKPSELSSTDSQSDTENESVRSDPHSFVNHYANVNDSLRQSWKRQKPVRNYSSYTDSEPEGSAVVSLNGGQIIMNNMARSRAPLPGFSSFV